MKRKMLLISAVFSAIAIVSVALAQETAQAINPNTFADDRQEVIFNNLTVTNVASLVPNLYASNAASDMSLYMVPRTTILQNWRRAIENLGAIAAKDKRTFNANAQAIKKYLLILFNATDTINENIINYYKNDATQKIVDEAISRLHKVYTEMEKIEIMHIASNTHGKPFPYVHEILKESAATIQFITGSIINMVNEYLEKNAPVASQAAPKKKSKNIFKRLFNK